MPEKQGSGVMGQGPGKCRQKGCQIAVDPGYDFCFAHRVEQDAAREEAQRERDEQIGEDFRLTFGSESGERVLAYLASAFFLGDSTISLNKEEGIDPVGTVFSEGGRFVVLRILSLAGRLNLKNMENLWQKKK